jgi:hypothetical protein
MRRVLELCAIEGVAPLDPEHESALSALGESEA